MHKEIEVGLCGPGRHEIKNANDEEITEFIFGTNVEDPNDFSTLRENVRIWLSDNIEPLDEAKYGPWGNDVRINLKVYVTGLTQCTTSVINSVSAWNRSADWSQKVLLSLMHFDFKTKAYREERWILPME